MSDAQFRREALARFGELPASARELLGWMSEDSLMFSRLQAAGDARIAHRERLLRLAMGDPKATEMLQRWLSDRMAETPGSHLPMQALEMAGEFVGGGNLLTKADRILKYLDGEQDA